MPGNVDVGLHQQGASERPDVAVVMADLTNENSPNLASGVAAQSL